MRDFSKVRTSSGQLDSKKNCINYTRAFHLEREGSEVSRVLHGSFELQSQEAHSNSSPKAQARGPLGPWPLLGCPSACAGRWFRLPPQFPLPALNPVSVDLVAAQTWLWRLWVPCFSLLPHSGPDCSPFVIKSNWVKLLGWRCPEHHSK